MIKVLTLFSGIGAPERALEKIGIEHEVVGISENDKFAVATYKKLHGDVNNLGDIREIKSEDLPEADLVVWGFPCQDISLIGKKKGLLDGEKSSLYFYGMDIIRKVKPKISVIENVKALSFNKNKSELKMILQDLEDAGYNNYYEILNAKDYGIPQNRERIFIVSIRKDIDNKKFQFPEPTKSCLKLKDLLEEVVDDKYFKSTQSLIGFCSMVNRNGFIRGKRFRPYFKDVQEYAYTIVASGAGRAATDNYVMTLNGARKEDIDIKDKEKLVEQIKNNQIRIRKLTPLEITRLTGFTDEDYKSLREIEMSDTQIMKQMGNSIVVNVLEELFKNIFLVEGKDK